MSLFCKRSAMQILGGLMQKPSLLEETPRPLTKDDFAEPFHKIVFGCIKNLAIDGVTDIDYIAIDNFLSDYPQQHEIFNDNKGMEYLIDAKEKANLANFDYSYNRVMKFSLLRRYRDIGIDVSDIYNDDIISIVKSEEMQETFDSMSLNDIMNEIDKKILDVKNDFSSSIGSYGQKAGKGLIELKEKLKLEPEIGSPLCSKIFNTVFRGARLKKFYLRSLPTGGGKSRLAIADATNLSVDELYDLEKKEWTCNGIPESSLFITTELEKDEVQTVMLAFVSGVEEGKILDGSYTGDEEDRVNRAIEIIDRSPLYIEHLPDFDIEDVERTIHRNVLNNETKFIFFDYIHLSHKMLMTIGQQTKGMKLREDIVLLLFATRLKDICNKLGVFLFSATQLNGEWENAKNGNQNLLRGSKAIADKLDCAMITFEVTKTDLDSLEPILLDGFGVREPNMVTHVYKNRRGKWNRIKIWSYIDLGNCRTEDLFVTDNDYRLIPIVGTNIATYFEDDETEINSNYNIEVEDEEIEKDLSKSNEIRF